MSQNLPDCLIGSAPGSAGQMPLDVYDLAVRLESEGVTDAVAGSGYGYASTLAMAQSHFNRMLAEQDRSPKPAPPPARAVGFVQYLHGIAFALPVLICTFTTLFFQLSLWGGELPADSVAAVAIGTIFSFVVTGGIIQASARRTLYHVHSGNWDAAISTSNRWARLGVQVLASAACAGWLVNRYFNWLPYPVDWVALSFFLALGCLWLACGALYALELSWAVSVAVVIGIAVVAVLRSVLAWPLVVAQVAGIAVAAALSFAWAAFALRKKRAGNAPGELLSLRLTHDLAPYFFYGCGYYLFLFADRFLAWTAATSTASLPFQFRGDYETALDIAMIAFVAQAGWVHVSILAFYKRVKESQSIQGARSAINFNRTLMQFYFRRTGLFLPVAAATSWIIYVLSVHFGLLPTAQMRMIAAVAFVSYTVLVIGLWNASLCFALSRPVLPMAAIAAGLAVNVIAGYLLSRVGSYHYAVFGFAAGSSVFALMTTAMYLRLSRKLDYLHFASAA